jgi:hypothetical protein
LIVSNNGVSTVDIQLRTDDSTSAPTDYNTANIQAGFTSTSWNDAYLKFQTHADNTSSFTDDMIIKGGKVGIDHADPNFLLCVGDDNASDNDSNGQILIGKRSSAGSRRSMLLTFNSSYDFVIGDNVHAGSGYSLTEQFKMSYACAANSLVINSSSDIGIGTASPSSKLEVYGGNTGGTAFNDTVLLLSGDSNENYGSIGMLFNQRTSGCGAKSAIFAKDYAGTWCRSSLVFCTNNESNSDDASLSDARLVIRENGNVGLVTTSPSAQLHIKTNSQDAVLWMESYRQANRIYKWATSGSNGEGIDFRDGYNSNNRIWLYYNNSYQSFYMNGSEQMKINTTGVGVKKTPSGYALDVSGSGRATSFVETSDQRVKTNIVDYSTATCLQVVNSIPIKKYDYTKGYNNNQKGVVGFLADDIVNNPELTSIVQKHDELGETTQDDEEPQVIYKDFLGVAKPRLISFLIGAVQELQKQITDLKKEMVNLKS